MLALAQYGRFAFVALTIFVRLIVAKCNFGRAGSGVWVTSRTGTVTLIPDKLQ
jgi:hypothetical protein